MAPDNPTGHGDSWQLGIGLVAVLALALGFWQLRNSIRMPFALPINSNSTELTNTPSNSDDIEALKNKDSDQDGLSDYDEIYLYHTSPYLKDTDSDGIDDKTEITRGTDPNCPEGKTCSVVSFQNPANSSAGNPAGTGTSSLPTAAAIRDYLKKNGATDDFLVKYSDQELLTMYQQVAGEVPAQSASPATLPNNSTNNKLTLKPEDKAALQKMNASELRQFLIKSGADKTTLDKIDDATLKAMVAQIISE